MSSLEEDLNLQRDKVIGLLSDREAEEGAEGLRAAAARLGGAPTTGGPVTEGQILFYSEELALKNQQIASLRRDKADLERRVSDYVPLRVPFPIIRLTGHGQKNIQFQTASQTRAVLC